MSRRFCAKERANERPPIEGSDFDRARHASRFRTAGHSQCLAIGKAGPENDVRQAGKNRQATSGHLRAGYVRGRRRSGKESKIACGEVPMVVVERKKETKHNTKRLSLRAVGRQ